MVVQRNTFILCNNSLLYHMYFVEFRNSLASPARVGRQRPQPLPQCWAEQCERVLSPDGTQLPFSPPATSLFLLPSIRLAFLMLSLLLFLVYFSLWQDERLCNVETCAHPSNSYHPWINTLTDIISISSMLNYSLKMFVALFCWAKFLLQICVCVCV